MSLRGKETVFGPGDHPRPPLRPDEQYRPEVQNARILAKDLLSKLMSDYQELEEGEHLQSAFLEVLQFVKVGGLSPERKSRQEVFAEIAESKREALSKAQETVDRGVGVREDVSNMARETERDLRLLRNGVVNYVALDHLRPILTEVLTLAYNCGVGVSETVAIRHPAFQETANKAKTKAAQIILDILVVSGGEKIDLRDVKIGEE